MANPMSLDEQSLTLDAIVALIEIDATALGGQVLRFTTGPISGDPVVFGGVSYRPLPSRITGIRAGGGRQAEPLLEVALADERLMALIAGRDELTGATVSRTRTLTKYLDGQPGADAGKHWPTDVWRIAGLAKRERATIAWRLISPLAVDGLYLPGRQVLRDVCSWTYRAWTGSGWDYTQAQCPYRGSSYYNLLDQSVTSPAADICSRHISGCRARFGEGTTLPFGGFAGVGRGQR